MTNNFSMEFLHIGETVLRKHLRRKNQGLRSQTIFLIDFFKTKKTAQKRHNSGSEIRIACHRAEKKAFAFSHSTCLSQL